MVLVSGLFFGGGGGGEGDLALQCSPILRSFNCMVVLFHVPCPPFTKLEKLEACHNSNACSLLRQHLTMMSDFVDILCIQWYRLRE